MRYSFSSSLFRTGSSKTYTPFSRFQNFTGFPSYMKTPENSPESGIRDEFLLSGMMKLRCLFFSFFTLSEEKKRQREC